MKKYQRRLTKQSLPQRFLSLIIGSSIALAFLVATGVAAAGGILLLNYRHYEEQYVPPAEMKLNQSSSGAKILDRNGQLLYQFVDDKSGVRNPVNLDEISPNLIAATIATEDSSFFQNPGINFNGVFRAISESLVSFKDTGQALSGSGGSSITQQLVKNVYIPEDERATKSIDRKFRELVYAARITQTEPKEQILEWYLNEISYGEIYSGVEAASEGYFGKPASQLTLAEATLLAGIPQSPGQLDPRTNMDAALARRNEVINLMERQSSIDIGYGRSFTVDKQALDAVRNQPVTLKAQTFPIQAPHFVLTYILPQLEEMFGHDALLHDGLVITTSLDLDLQDRAQQVLETSIRRFEAVSNTHNGATVVFDAHTGEILVMLGSRDYYRNDIDGQINNLLALNSPGSTFKPFVYLTGFLEKGWSPDTIIQDSPISFLQANGTVFSPTNPGGGYHGPISIRNALGNSLNVPAFRAAVEIGVSPIIKLAKRMGFTGLANFYGPSIALGGVDFKAMDLAYGYSVFANSGIMVGQDTFAPDAADEKTVQPIGILKVVDGDGNVRFDVDAHRVEQRIVPAEKADSITSILSDPSARCITFGCGGLTIPGYQVAVKTGTSEPFDANGPNGGKIGETWAFGYTPDLVVGVWAGNSNNAPIDHIFSTSISFQAMRDILLESYKGRAVTPFSLSLPGTATQ